MKTMIDELIESGTGDDVLRIREKIEEIILSLRIQLRQYIIEQQNRMILDALSHELDLTQLQRQCCRSLLTLRSEFSDILPIDRKAEVITMWSDQCQMLAFFLFTASLERRGEIFRCDISIVADAELLDTSGQLVMDATDDTLKLLDELLPDGDDLLAIEAELFIPYRQGIGQDRTHDHILQQLVPLIECSIIPSQMIQVHLIQLAELKVHKAAPKRRSILDETEILRTEADDVRDTEEFRGMTNRNLIDGDALRFIIFQVHINTVGNLAFPCLHLDMCFIMTELDQIPVMGDPVGFRCTGQEDGFEYIGFSLCIVAEKNIRSGTQL